MPGALVSLIATGCQDAVLTQDPEITYWKTKHSRHTNFARESIEQTFNGSVSKGGRITATISRNGDLFHGAWLEFDVKVGEDTSITADYSAFDLIKKVRIEVGGSNVDEQPGHYMKTYMELSSSSDERAVLAEMSTLKIAGKADMQKVRVPLNSFWFCKDHGQALPLIALQYHEVKIIVELADHAELNTARCALWVDYVFLDGPERKRFARDQHQYLFEQVQSVTESVPENAPPFKPKLQFNHPCKELIWTFHSTSTGKQLSLDQCKLDRAKIRLNGHDLFADRDAKYFSQVQRYTHHTNGGSATGDSDIFLYSFALFPEKLQPSGTCNMSRIDNSSLELTFASGAPAMEVRVTAVNYNVLRLTSGMGGVAYSN